VYGNSDQISRKLGQKQDQPKVLFKECSEPDVKKGTRKICAPLLFLFFGCDLMVKKNEDDLQAIANWMVYKFENLVMKQGAKLEKIKMCFYWIHAGKTNASKYIEVGWQDCNYCVGKFQPKPKVGTFRVKYPLSKFWSKGPYPNQYQTTTPSPDCGLCNNWSQIARHNHEIISDFKIV
jgi:hypothetical protein